MVTALNSHTAGGFALSEEALQGMVSLFSAYDFSAIRKARHGFLAGTCCLRASIRRGWSGCRRRRAGRESLQHFTRQAGSAHASSVFASVENLWTGIQTHHAAKRHGGTELGRRTPGMGGLVAGADALRRGIIGASVAVEEDDGTMTTQTQSQPGKAIVEGALAGTAIAAALKIAERNTMGLK